MNTITLTGNVVADAEKVQLGDGKMLVNFRMGNNEYVNGESRSNGFFDVTVFGPQAERVLTIAKKGERIVATGRMQHNTFQREDGSTGGRTKLVATAIGLSLEFDNASR